MGHLPAAVSGLRYLCHRGGVLKPCSGQDSFEASRPGMQNGYGPGITVYAAVSTFASERGSLVFRALFRLSQVAANTISAPTNTQICSGSP